MFSRMKVTSPLVSKGTAQPLAAGQAAKLQKKARTYFAEVIADIAGNTGTFPAGGYVIFYDGKPVGWMVSLDKDKAENGRLTHRPGCFAVVVDGPAQIWQSVGGDYQGGAEKWEACT